MSNLFRISAVFLSVCTLAVPSWSIGKREFFARLQESWNQIRTFQSDVVQESRYSDGVIQRYKGVLALDEMGRIAYDYKLNFETFDENLIPENERASTPPPEPSRTESPGAGSYRAYQDMVNHYDPAQNLIVESPEDETILIQVFRSMLGQGDFDVEEFMDDNKVTDITEEVLEDGTPVFRMVAKPKRGTDAAKWAKESSNALLNWEQELWVEQANMRPVKAVLIAKGESTTVWLSNASMNQPVDPKLFLIQSQPGQPPKKLPKGTSFRQATPEREFQGLTLDEIPVEKD